MSKLISDNFLLKDICVGRKVGIPLKNAAIKQSTINRLRLSTLSLTQRNFNFSFLREILTFFIIPSSDSQLYSLNLCLVKHDIDIDLTGFKGCSRDLFTF